MNTVSSASDLMTFEDFCVLVSDGRKADLIDGVIYMASADSRRANQLTSLVSSLLEMFVAHRGLGGEVYVNRFAFQLDPWTALEPDVAYVSAGRLNLVQEGRMEGGPDVAVEIVSRDSRERDYIQKRKLYEAHGVGEYWIIDDVQRRAEFLRLGADGRYDYVPLRENRWFESRPLPGCRLNVEWFIADPLPNAWECLQPMLGGA